MLEIVTLGDEILSKIAEPVVDFKADLPALIEGMFEAMHRQRGVGLAAPQVGRSIRLFVTDVEDDKPRVFINPEIVLTSPELVNLEEGCLSVPGIYEKVVRPRKVKLQAWNERGRPFVLEADDFLARVLQHELDHLNGFLFLDRLGKMARERVLKTYERHIRI